MKIPKIKKIWAVSLIVSLISLAILFKITDFRSIMDRLEGANLYFIGLLLLLYFIAYLCRAMRLWLLIRPLHPVQPVGLWACLRLTLAHQAIFAVAPSGSGDLAFPVLGRMITGTDIRDIIPVLISFRLQDLATLIAFAGFGLVVILDLTGSLDLFWVLLFFLLSGFILTLFVAGLNNHIRYALWHISQKADRIIGAFKSQSSKEDEGNGRPLADSAPDRKTILLSALMTVLSWSFTGAMVWAAFRAYNMSLDWQLIPYLIAGLNLAGALAFTTIGGLGVTELGLAGLLVAASIPASTAIPLAMVVRPTLLLATILFGLCALGGPLSPDRNTE